MHIRARTRALLAVAEVRIGGVARAQKQPHTVHVGADRVGVTVVRARRALVHVCESQNVPHPLHIKPRSFRTSVSDAAESDSWQSSGVSPALPALPVLPAGGLRAR